MSVNVSDFKSAITHGNLLWKRHALERMMERGIPRNNVKQAIINGEIIESYPDDYPTPSYLICDLTSTPLHVVVSYDIEDRLLHIITVYVPDLKHFKNDYKTRIKF